MVIDSSAIIAITNQESGFENILEKIFQEDIQCCISAVTRFEIFIVTLNQRDENAWQETLELLESAKVEIIPVTEDMLELGRVIN